MVVSGGPEGCEPEPEHEHASLLLQAWQGVNMLGVDRGIYPWGEHCCMACNTAPFASIMAELSN